MLQFWPNVRCLITSINLQHDLAGFVGLGRVVERDFDICFDCFAVKSEYF
jgi:hypothetical protein